MNPIYLAPLFLINPKTGKYIRLQKNQFMPVLNIRTTNGRNILGCPGAN